jgi:hypothetical protein
MIMHHFWNNTDRAKPKYWDRNLSQCHLVHHKSHVDWSGIGHKSPCCEVCVEVL